MKQSKAGANSVVTGVKNEAQKANKRRKIVRNKTN
jgi:hypothetical protein